MNALKIASSQTQTPGSNNDLDSYILKIKKELDVLVPDHNSTTIKPLEKRSSIRCTGRHDLKGNNSIAIKSAD